MATRAIAYNVSTDPNRMARALGWFSIGLGVAELIAPRGVAKITGTKNHRALIRSYGLREIASGVGILTTPRPATWLWSRVGGDVLDLASLAAAIASPRNNRGKALGAAAVVAGVTALDILCAQKLSAEAVETNGHRPARAESNLIINRSPDECYQYWSELKNLPRFMSYLESVNKVGDKRSHWVANIGGMRMEWDAEIVEDVPGRRIAWRSLPGGSVSNSGSVQFDRAAGGRGTIVRVQMDYDHPARAIASVFAKFVGRDPEQVVYKDLRRFKQVMETGEVIRTEGQPAGRKHSTGKLDVVAR